MYSFPSQAWCCSNTTDPFLILDAPHCKLLCSFHHLHTSYFSFIYISLDSPNVPSCVLSTRLHFFMSFLSIIVHADFFPGFFDPFPHPYVVGLITVLFCLTSSDQYTVHPVYLPLSCFLSPLLAYFLPTAMRPWACCLQKLPCQFPCL